MIRKQKPKQKPKRASSASLERDTTREFEQLLKTTVSGERYVLQLFITGTTPRSALAIANVRALCEEYLTGRYDLEVVDIYQQPGAAAEEQIIAAPTLLKKMPMPLKRMVGDLTDRDKVIVGLNLSAASIGKGPKGTKWAKL
jgi:circadian clock protein KaiB